LQIGYDAENKDGRNERINKNTDIEKKKEDVRKYFLTLGYAERWEKICNIYIYIYI
jgi:hypothetical protein